VMEGIRRMVYPKGVFSSYLYNFIGAQRKSEGGSIAGSSPTSTSDNIPIMATAEEFMQPVKSVKYYGKQVMEGLRQRAIPKEIFSTLRFPSINIPRPSMSYAGGGEIAAVRRSTEQSKESSKPVEIKIANYVDPAEVGNFLATVDGENAILNVISSRMTEVRRIIR